MTWVEIRDSDPESPWVLTLRRLLEDDDTDRALAIMVRALLWTARNQHDGDLSRYDLGDLAWAWRLRAEDMPHVVEAGIVLGGPGTYAMGADYLDRTARMRRERARSAARRAAEDRGETAERPRSDRGATAAQYSTEQNSTEHEKERDSVVASAPTTEKAKAPKPTLTESQREWVTAVAAAWTEGVEGTVIPAATPPSARTAPRDRLLLTLRETYPDPAEWRAMARALAGSTHHRGENERRWVASLPWVLGNKPKLAEWMERGQALATNTAKPAPGPSLALLPAQRVSRPGDASRMLAEMARGWGS